MEPCPCWVLVLRAWCGAGCLVRDAGCLVQARSDRVAAGLQLRDCRALASGTARSTWHLVPSTAPGTRHIAPSTVTISIYHFIVESFTRCFLHVSRVTFSACRAPSGNP